MTRTVRVGSSIRRSTRWLPMKPAPPVTTSMPMEQLIQERGLPAKMLICLSAHNGAKESPVAHRRVSLNLSSGGEPTLRRDLAQFDISVNLRWQGASEIGTA